MRMTLVPEAPVSAGNQMPRATGEYLMDVVKPVLPLARVLAIFSPRLREKLGEVERAFDDVTANMGNRDLFVQKYSPSGWVHHDSFSTGLTAELRDLSLEEGELALTRYHLDERYLERLGWRVSNEEYRHWSPLYERAIERIVAEDYLSAVPLLLIVIDGMYSREIGKSPFSMQESPPVFDCEAAAPGGVESGYAILGTVVRRFSDDPISKPLRHGIMHGLTPDFGHPIVAAKTINLLHATIDYLDGRRDEDWRLEQARKQQEPVAWRQLIRRMARTAEHREALEAWEARPPVVDCVIASSGFAEGLPIGSPEASAALFLELLVARNYGKLAELTFDYQHIPRNLRAGELRDDLADVQVTEWRISGYEDCAPGLSRISICLQGFLRDQRRDVEAVMRLVFATEDRKTLARGQSGGSWLVMPDFVANLRTRMSFG